MNLNSILSVFTPKDTKFFGLLNEAAAVLYKAGTLVAELFDPENNERRAELCRAIKEAELEGDKVTAKIFKELNNTFITPFDREDIGALADEIDDSTDAINRVAQKVFLFSPEVLPASTTNMANTIKKAANEVKLACSKLSNLKNLSQVRVHTKQIKNLEEEADHLYEDGTSQLFFNKDMRTLELVKVKEIIQELEKSANKINNVGKVLKTITVKYA
jgi:predicted phosphate transport protein (TIGR00153 family)